ncbi:MAG: hypothetical protein RI935_455 [Candidatus Parcubacteria bacterium]|jgi:hypothetical protein
MFGRKHEPQFDVNVPIKSEEEMDYVEKKTAELKNILEKLNIDLLIDIFREIHLKSIVGDDADPYAQFLKIKERIRRIIGEDIFVNYSKRMNHSGGLAYYDSGSIGVSSELLSDQTSELGILKIILHELVHSFSGRGGKGLEGCRKLNAKEHFLDDTRTFVALNEAVTEFVADHVLVEYIKRGGDRKMYSNFDKDFKNHQTYFFEKTATREAVHGFSKEFGVPEDIVLQALVGHYVRGDFSEVFEDMTDDEKKLFDGVKENNVTLVQFLRILFKKLTR